MESNRIAAIKKCFWEKGEWEKKIVMVLKNDEILLGRNCDTSPRKKISSSTDTSSLLWETVLLSTDLSETLLVR